ncbi:MAG: PAS domain S-box protein [Bacteroidales bacterium]|nr:PAS domain S-box protein [Bacteroidales bacterium]
MKNKNSFELNVYDKTYSFVITPVLLQEYINLYGTNITLLRNAELKISEQNNFITAITEAVPDMISIIELPERKLFYTNRDPFNLQGFNSDQLKIMKAEERNELVHPDDRKALSDYFAKLSQLENSSEIMLDYRAINFEKKWMWFRARGRVFERNADGSVKNCINVVQNITEKKIAEEKLRESEEQLKAIFDHAAIGIVVTDSNDRFIKVNERLCEILEYPKEELLGKTIYEITYPDDLSLSREMNEKIHHGEVKNL